MQLYLLERHDVIGAGRGALLEMLRDRWSPHLEERFGLTPVGLWAAVGSTGRWPEAWSLTRAEDLSALGSALDDMHPMEAHASYAYELWRHSLKVRSGGTTRLLVPAPGSKVAAAFDSRVSLFEEVRVRSGREVDYRTALHEELEPLNAELGYSLLGTFEEPFAAGRVVNLWAVPDWPDLSVAADGSAAGSSWDARLDELVEQSSGFLLAAAPSVRLGT